MKNKTLHLNLKKKWFDMILSGEKKEEYREIKPYWEKRFCFAYCSYLGYQGHASSIYKNLFISDVTNSHLIVDTITFSNGYSKNRPQFEIEFKGFEIKEGKQEWGAEKGKKYFVLKLGKIKNNKK